jgi:Ca2+-binding EF-hand superfamily protein
MPFGLCSCCCAHLEQHDLNEGSTRPPQKKIRPLLADLEQQFKDNCGDDNLLEASELVRIWKSAAIKKVGKLTKEEENLIEHSCKLYFRQMDIDNTGKISFDEFMTYMMGASEDRGALPVQQFRRDINQKLKKDPSAIERLIQQFKSWDKNKDGKVTPDELDQVLEEMKSSSASATSISELKMIKNCILKDADVDGDGQIDLWEMMAFMLGRKKTPVEVLMYDVSKGMAAKLTPILMGKKLQAIHTGVLVYQSEYWCGGKIFRSEPPCSKVFGEPMTEYSPLEKLNPSMQRPDLSTIFIGYTFVTHDEFTSWLARSVVPRYSRAQYDILTHSCNHFTNEALQFLTGNPLPERIFELQKSFVTPTFLAMRPFLNRFMCCFGDMDKDIDLKTGFASDYMPEARAEDSSEVVQQVLGSGEVVVLEGIDGLPEHGSVVGTILRAEGGKLDVKFFHPLQEKVVELKGVDAKKVKKI